MGRVLILAVLSLLLADAVAETPEEKGLAIAVEADRRDLGWNDSTSSLTMLLRNRQGDESLRFIRVRNLEVEGDGDKGLTIFDEPRDVKGTAFLTFTHKTGPDDQWLYLPALKRVKRISSKNKSGPFMGSEFAYEDISSNEVEKYTYKYLRDEACGELQCFVVERYPVDPNSGYTRHVAWLDKDEYRSQLLGLQLEMRELARWLYFQKRSMVLVFAATMAILPASSWMPTCSPCSGHR